MKKKQCQIKHYCFGGDIVISKLNKSENQNKHCYFKIKQV
jgi:hypothetical protein